MEIVARAFSPTEFAEYVKGVRLGSAGWTPKFCVRHNTGAPTLAQRPIGLTHQHMLNLASYYSSPPLSWRAGPHLFVDDKQIWVFSSLLHPGVHSPSWNDVSFGIEQLGDYDVEDYNHGRGLAVQQNAIAAFAVLSHFAGIDSHTMRDHYMDPKTTHRDCPGKSCRVGREQFCTDVHDYIVAHLL